MSLGGREWGNREPTTKERPRGAGAPAPRLHILPASTRESTRSRICAREHRVRHPKNGEQSPSMIPETPGYTRARRLLSLSSVVRDALPMMRAAVANTAVLRIAMDEHAPLVEANPVAMHRVLMKLVQNAFQAIRQPDGVIEIGVAGMTSSDCPSHPFVRLTVADNGIGMDS